MLLSFQAAESGYGSESSLRKGGSMLSLTSVTSLSTTASSSSFKVLQPCSCVHVYCTLTDQNGFSKKPLLAGGKPHNT